MRIKPVGLTSLLLYAVAITGVHAQNSGESLAIMPSEIVWKTPPTALV
jgi:hypothetical protein